MTALDRVADGTLCRQPGPGNWRTAAAACGWAQQGLRSRTWFCVCCGCCFTACAREETVCIMLHYVRTFEFRWRRVAMGLVANLSPDLAQGAWPLDHFECPC
jgi:hypothetical protein